MVHRPRPLSRRAATLAGLLGLCLALTGAGEIAEIRRGVTRQQRRLLMPGDLVFRSGTSIESSVVLSARMNSHYSHVGVAAFEGDQLGVVSALPAEGRFPGGVVWSDWTEYSLAEDVTHVGIYRVMGTTPADRLRVAATAMSLIGLPFDNGFRLHRSGRLYCTKVAMRAVASVVPEVLSAVRAQEVFLLDEPVYTPDSLLLWDRLAPVI